MGPRGMWHPTHREMATGQDLGSVAEAPDAFSGVVECATRCRDPGCAAVPWQARHFES